MSVMAEVLADRGGPFTPFDGFLIVVLIALVLGTGVYIAVTRFRWWRQDKQNRR